MNGLKGLIHLTPTDCPSERNRHGEGIHDAGFADSEGTGETDHGSSTRAGVEAPQDRGPEGSPVLDRAGCARAGTRRSPVDDRAAAVERTPSCRGARRTTERS